VAISADGERWFLLNASPDVREQVRRLSPGTLAPVPRHVPIEGVILTDAEIDHSLGIVLLREAAFLPLYMTKAVESVLDAESRFLPLARAFAAMPCVELPLGAPIGLLCRDGTPSGLSVEAFAVPSGPPQFAPTAAAGHTVGLFIREMDGGPACAFVPGCAALDRGLLDRLMGADLLLFDGTFWSDDELVALGISPRTARDMDHLPIGGPDGSLELLASLPCRHRVYTHINNTNPILLEASAERAAVVEAGLTVGYDGQLFVM